VTRSPLLTLSVPGTALFVLEAALFVLATALFALATALAPAAHASTPRLPGEQTYEQLCISCHGPEGKGDGPAGISALPMPRDFSVGQFKFDADSDGRTGTDTDLFLVIRGGALKAGGSPLMAAWPNLSDERLRELVAYIRSLVQSE
jgi:mono/diheme cytochrome c family protein